MTVYSEAIAEAYAAAPSDVVILHTLEISNSEFIDDDGKPNSIWVTNDNHNVRARLEESAPIKASEWIDFVSYGFTFKLSAVDDKINPGLQFTIDNVSRLIVANIDRAIMSRNVIKVTYRPYLSTDLTAPHYDPPLRLTLSDISADVFKVTAKARFHELGNLTFPGEVYTGSRFKGLNR